MENHPLMPATYPAQFSRGQSLPHEQKPTRALGLPAWRPELERKRFAPHHSSTMIHPPFFYYGTSEPHAPLLKRPADTQALVKMII
jgi:hypothetical protein